MKKPEIPQDERKRLEALERYKVLDSLPEREYDDLTLLAAEICSTPIALISLVDKDRQWFKSRVGIDVSETPRDISFCGHVVAESSILIVPDALHDPRFDDNPLVAQDPKIRFYTGVPLTTPDRYVLGTLCVIDYRKRELTERQIQQLEALSRLVISLLELRLNLKLSQDLIAVVKETNEKLNRATRLKDEFLANMSHELRTPLNAILGMSEGLQDGVFGAVNERQIGALQLIERSGTHLLELINDILDVAKIESGNADLDLAPTSIAQLCQLSMALIAPQAEKKCLRLELKLPQHLPELNVDERRMRQVLVNLLSNAVKFTPAGGCISLEVTQVAATISNSPLQNFLRIAVTDTGIGIAPEDIEKLFQPFIQIDSSLNRQYNGTGLGLSLVKRIVELHGGHIGLTSQVGEGSCFSIDLPHTPTSPSITPSIIQVLSRSEVSSDRVAEAATKSESGLKAGALILLAEDNEANINTISSYLGAKGFRMLLARNGKEAIAMVKTHQPDAILMDIQMPEMDGLEAIRLIRQEPHLSKIPIVALTALAMDGDRDRCIKAGANEYLSKPIKLKQLNDLIEQLCK